jgi:hypothetical protein
MNWSYMSSMGRQGMYAQLWWRKPLGRGRRKCEDDINLSYGTRL